MAHANQRYSEDCPSSVTVSTAETDEKRPQSAQSEWDQLLGLNREFGGAGDQSSHFFAKPCDLRDRLVYDLSREPISDEADFLMPLGYRAYEDTTS
jgi:hypothetical protein